MPLPNGPAGFGLFSSATALLGPLGIVIAAFTKPGPVRALLRAHADCPDRARRPSTLGIDEPPLQPLIRAGIVIREANGCVWVDRARAKQRQKKLMMVFGAVGAVIGVLAWWAIRG